MPIGSHKDAFRAHQLVKRATQKEGPSVLVRLAADVLLDFVKSQRQVNARSFPEVLPTDATHYERSRLIEALQAVAELCGQCEEGHDNNCFINQARRSLIAALTSVDIGAAYDGKTAHEELLRRAEETAAAQVPKDAAVGADSTPAESSQEGPSEVLELRRRLDSLAEKDVFRATLIDEVVDTIRSVAAGNFAAEMPVHDDEQLGKLATAFNIMLGTVKETMAGLDRLVAERSAELKQIMRTVPVGLMTLDDALRINAEYSRSTEEILRAEDLRGRDFLDTIGLTKRRADERSQLEGFLDVLRMQMLSADELGELNPVGELELEGSSQGDSRWIRTRFCLLEQGNGASSNILALLEDITKEKQLCAQVEESRNANSCLTAIAEDPDLFREFLRETRRILNAVAHTITRLPEVDEQRPLIDEIFRGVHTIKGGAGSFGLGDLGSLAGRLEDQLSAVRSTGVLDPALLSEVEKGIERLVAATELAKETAVRILGDDLESEEPILRVPLQAIKDMEQLAQRSDADRTSEDLVTCLRRLREVPARRALAKSVKIVPSLIERLGKRVRFVFEGDSCPIDIEVAREVNNALIHLLRNSFDHGVEEPEERLSTGKPPEAVVTLAIQVEDAALQVYLSDDGRGIDPDKIRAAALANGMRTADQLRQLSDEQALRLIFLPGFSTCHSVSDISGRGVGMDAVADAIERGLHGTIGVESQLGLGTRFSLRVPRRTT